MSNVKPFIVAKQPIFQKSL